MEESKPKPEVKRTLGTFSIVLMVVAATAPLTVVAGTQPLVMTYAGNISIPVYYLATGLILVLFSVGFTTMSAHVPNAGAFYSYIQAGLGKKMGLGAATMALLSYTLICIAVMAYLGYATESTVELFVPGLGVPWFIYALGWWAVTAFLGYHNIDMSSKVLGAFLVLEVAVVTTLDVTIVGTGGVQGLSAAPFLPSNFMSGTPGLGLMWAFFGFIGYEATAVFRSEAKDPERTIPRATYLAVGFIALFYGFSAWCLVMGAGPDSALAFAEETEDGYALELAAAYVGPWLSNVIQCLLVTSLFACALSLHNVAARYVFTLSNVKVFPEILGRIHPKHFAPSNASMLISCVTFGLLAVVTAIGLDPLVIYAWFANAATLGLLLLQCMTSVSVIAFFRRVPSGKGAWHTVVAPGIATVALAFVTFVVISNFPDLTGDMTSALVMGCAIPASFALGFALAGRMEKSRPGDYALLSNLVSQAPAGA
jgi:amino acid transporter